MTIAFRAFDGDKWWYEGEMNGYQYYRTTMEKNGSNWSFHRSGQIIASNTMPHNKLQYRISGHSAWQNV